jgi:hypothetical protein
MRLWTLPRQPRYIEAGNAGYKVALGRTIAARAPLGGKQRAATRFFVIRRMGDGESISYSIDSGAGQITFLDSNNHSGIKKEFRCLCKYHER